MNGEQSMASSAGLVLLAADLTPIYMSAEAVRVLAYPETPNSNKFPDSVLRQKIRSMLLGNGNGAQSGFQGEFMSGRRRYVYRAFTLNSQANDGSSLRDHPTLALILERPKDNSSYDVSQVAVRFHLTPREQETLHYLMRGLTNKEIGHRMDISANTVKAFLRLMMMKMGVSTRSGLLGKAMSPCRTEALQYTTD